MNLISCTVEAEGDSVYICSDLFRLLLPASKAKCLNAAEEENIYVGIRPETLYFVEKQDPANKTESFQVDVKLVEPLGAEQLIHFTMAGTTMVARLDPHIPIRYRDRITLGVKMTEIQLFNHQTEKNIEDC